MTAAAIEAVIRFTAHRNHCDVFTRGGMYPCTCGLEEAKQAALAPGVPDAGAVASGRVEHVVQWQSEDHAGFRWHDCFITDQGLLTYNERQGRR